MEMRRRPRVTALGCALAGLLCAVPATAQDAEGGTPWLITVAQYGKWPALAGSAALLARAALDRRDARDRRAELDAYCLTVAGGCALTAAGRYTDPHADGLERAAAARDDRAHRLIVAGELALIATGVFFVLDLVHDNDDGPPNIPFTPFRVYASGARVGLEAPF